MNYSALRNTLLASAAAIVWCTTAAQAVSVLPPPPSPSDFQVLESESCDGPFCTGQFTVTNNSSAWSIYGFAVGNPSANVPFEQAQTTQDNWSAGKECFTFIGSSCSNSFVYNDNDGDLLSGLSTDIGPGQSSNKFTFGLILLASPVVLDLVNAGGGTSSVQFDATDVPAPEPASLAVLGAGLLGLAGVLRWRRAKPAVPRQAT